MELRSAVPRDLAAATAGLPEGLAACVAAMQGKAPGSQLRPGRRAGKGQRTPTCGTTGRSR